MTLFCIQMGDYLRKADPVINLIDMIDIYSMSTRLGLFYV